MTHTTKKGRPQRFFLTAPCIEGPVARIDPVVATRRAEKAMARLLGRAAVGVSGEPTPEPQRDDDRIDAAGHDWGEDGVPLGDRTAGIGPSPIDEGAR